MSVTLYHLEAYLCVAILGMSKQDWCLLPVRDYPIGCVLASAWLQCYSRSAPVFVPRGVVSGRILLMGLHLRGNTGRVLRQELSNFGRLPRQQVPIVRYPAVVLRYRIGRGFFDTQSNGLFRRVEQVVQLKRPRER